MFLGLGGFENIFRSTNVFMLNSFISLKIMSATHESEYIIKQRKQSDYMLLNIFCDNCDFQVGTCIDNLASMFNNSNT